MFPYRATSSGEDSPKPGSTLVCIKPNILIRNSIMMRQVPYDATFSNMLRMRNLTCHLPEPGCLDEFWMSHINTNYIKLQFTMVWSSAPIFFQFLKVEFLIYESGRSGWGNEINKSCWAVPCREKSWRKKMKIGMSCESSEVNLLCQVEVLRKLSFWNLRSQWQQPYNCQLFQSFLW